MKQFLVSRFLKVFIFVTFGLITSNGIAQVYPVQVQTAMQPPYPVFIDAYSQTGYNRLHVNIFPVYETGKSLDVYFKLIIDGPGGLHFESKETAIKEKKVTLIGGTTSNLTEYDLGFLFNSNKINFNGYPYSSTSGLPEGMYSFHFEVYEALTNRLISNPNAGNHVAWIATYEPPMLIMPTNESTISSTQPVINFLWTPRSINLNGSQLLYTLEIAEIQNYPNTTAEQAINQKIGWYYIQTPSTPYTSISLIANSIGLLPNKWYAYRIKVADNNPNSNQRMQFRNNGYSEAQMFYYGEICNAPQNLAVTEFNTNTVQANWDEEVGYTYDLEYRLTNNRFLSWTIVKNAISGTELQGFEDGKTYEFRVKKNCENNFSEYSDIVNVTISGIDVESCSPPTYFSVERLVNEEKENLYFRWILNENVEKYRITLEDKYNNFVREESKYASYEIESKESSIHGDTMYIQIDAFCNDLWQEGISYPIYLNSDYYSGGECTVTNDPEIDIKNYSSGTTEISWIDDPKFKEYLFKWRPLGSSAAFNEIITNDAKIQIFGVYPGQLFEYQIQYFCYNGQSDLGTSNVFIGDTLGALNVERTGNCYPPEDFRYYLPNLEELQFTWTLENDVNKYEFQWKESSDQDWTTVQTKKDETKISAQSGKEYQGRIRSICSDGGGYSRWSNTIFVIVKDENIKIVEDDCPTPTHLLPVLLSSSEVKVEISKNDDHSFYVSEYRKLGSEIWTQGTTSGIIAKFTELTPETSYEYRIKGYCGNIASEYCDIDVFTTLKKTAQRDDYACGESSSFTVPADGENATLSIGDKFIAGGWELTVESLTGDASGYGGFAYAQIPYLNDSKGVFSLNSVTVKLVNGEKVMFGGSSIANLNHVTIQLLPEAIREQVNQIVDLVDQGINTAQDVQKFAEDVVEELERTGELFETPDLSKYDNLSPQEKLIKAYELIQDGTSLIESGAIIDGGKELREGEALLELALSQGAKDIFATESPALLKDTVHFFANTNQNYGYDFYRYNENKDQFYYIKMKDGDYYIPFKSVAEGSGDKVNISLPEGCIFNTQSGLIGENVVKIFLNENEYFVSNVSEINGRKSGEITFTGGTKKIKAISKRDVEGTDQDVNLGEVSIVEYEQQNLNLHLISVNKNTHNKTISTSTLQTELNKLYKQAIVNWTVSTNTDLNIDLSSLDFEIGDLTNVLPTDYTSGMNSLIQNAGVSEDSDDDFYLFIIQSVNSTTKYNGYMPIGKHCGFIILNNISQADDIPYVIAHELGHGAFTLRHTFGKENQYLFSEGETKNLMDYNSSVSLQEKCQLFKYQWDQIKDPDLLYWASGGSEGASLADASLSCVGESVLDPSFKSQLKNNIFITPEGKAIDLGKGRPYAFFNKNEEQTNLRGSLAAFFNGEGVLYRACYNTDDLTFAGYAPLESDLKDFYKNKLIYKKLPANSAQYVSIDKNGSFSILINGQKVGQGNTSGCNCNLLPYTMQYLDKVFNNVINYSSTDVDYTYLYNLISGEYPIIETDPNTGVHVYHKLKSKLYITDEDNLSDELLKEIEDDIKDNNDKTPIWIHQRSDGSFEYKSAVPDYVKNYLSQKGNVEWDSFFGQLVLIAKAANDSREKITLGVYEIFDEIANNIRNNGYVGRIPEKYWGCQESNIDILKYVVDVLTTVLNPYNELLLRVGFNALADKINESNISDASSLAIELKKLEGDYARAKFAFYCGVWNGLIELVASVPEAIKLIAAIQSQTQWTQFIKSVDNLSKYQTIECEGGAISCGSGECECGIFSAIKYGVKSQFSDECKIAEFGGEFAFVIILAIVGDPVALEGTLSTVAVNTLKVLKVIDNISGKLDAAGYFLGFAKKGGSILFKKVGSQKIKFGIIENGIFKGKVKNIDGSIENIDVAIEKVNTSLDGNDALIEISSNEKKVLVALSGIEDLISKLGNYPKLKTFVEQLDELKDVALIEKISKNIDDYDLLTKLNTDLTSSISDFQSILKNNPLLFDSWFVIKDFSNDIKKTLTVDDLNKILDLKQLSGETIEVITARANTTKSAKWILGLKKKVNILNKIKNYTDLKSFIKTLDESGNFNLLEKINDINDLHLTHLNDDISTSGFASAIKNNPDLIFAWGNVITHSLIRKHIITLEKISELLNDIDFINKLPNKQADLDDILNTVINPLESGTNSKLIKLSEHLENLKNVVKNHSDAIGFERLLSDMKSKNLNMQDGVTHMLNDLKNYPKGSVKKFDYEFDGDGIDCSKCRFDVEFKSGTPRMIEYKSWSLDNIPNLSTRQMIEYFRSANTIGDFKYIFNKLKTSDVTEVKNKVKMIFENRDKASEIFNSLGVSKFQQLFGVDNIDDFIEDVVPVLEGPNSIYRFIDIY